MNRTTEPDQAGTDREQERPRTPAEPEEGPRRRGRPRISAAVREENRRHIVAATERAFSRYGYHGVTVDRILEFAGLGRTQFYRAFRNVDEPMQIVADRYADSLVAALAEPMRRPGAGAEERLVTGLQAYVDHTLRHRHLLASYEAVLHDPATPIKAARVRATRAIAGLIREACADLGRTPPGDLEVGTFLTCAEFTCFRLADGETVSVTAVRHAQRVLIRSAISFLGDRTSWVRALDIPDLVPPGSHPPEP